MLGNNSAFQQTARSLGSSGSSVVESGELYALVGNIIIVPIRKQYLISGRLILDVNSIIRTDGQVVVI